MGFRRPAILPGNLRMGGSPQAAIGGMQYLVRDLFTDTRAAGAVNGTPATPGPGTRTVLDSGNNLTVGSNALQFGAGAVAPGDPGLWEPIRARVAGRMLLGRVVITSNSDRIKIGWMNTVSANDTNEALGFINVSNVLRAYISGVALAIGAWVIATYDVAIVFRAAGAYYFIKGDLFTNWTMLWQSGVTNNASAFPGVFNDNTAAAWSCPSIRVAQPTWLPTPLAYAAFGGANGALGNTDSAGPDGQGAPVLAWTSTAGTWGIASNKAACSVLAGGLGFATVNTSSADVQLSAALTRAGGVVGHVVRYVDSSNYLIAYHDGTNAKLDKVVAGATTNVITAVVAYSASATLVPDVVGTAARLYYNSTLVGSGAVPASSATVHGMYTTDITNTLDNFQAFAKGMNDGAYNGLNVF